MEVDEIKKQLDQAIADLEAARQDRDALASRVIALEASETSLQAELAQIKEERERIQADLTWKERSGLLASVFATDELERQKPTIMAMSKEAVELLVNAAKQKSQSGTITANLGGSDDGKTVVTLA